MKWRSSRKGSEEHGDSDGDGDGDGEADAARLAKHVTPLDLLHRVDVRGDAGSLAVLALLICSPRECVQRHL